MTLEVHKIKDLIRKLNHYTDLYNAGNTTISDEEWDKMYFELEQLEKSTGIIYPNSPTQTIHYESISALKKVQHNHPMLSLDKTKDPKEVTKFLFKDPEYWEWCAMFKLDVLTCSLTYEDGKLVRAETRGDGSVGDDITHNALVISSIPKEIPNKELVVVDGEIICKNNDFNLFFSRDYKNARNFAAGSIHLLSAVECAARKLTFVAWDLIKGCEDIDFFFWRLEKLDDWGFLTVPRVGDAETVGDAIEILDNMHEKDSIYKQYPIDGYVFRFESQKYYNSLGNTDHHFRGAIAYKFYDNEYETRLKNISYDVSRTGILTPVAVFEPIEIEGTIVERASLHNISIMEEILGPSPYYGQRIWVIKSNMIIPQITRADKRDYGDIIAAGGVTVGLGGDYGVRCPVCGGFTSLYTSDTGVKVLRCDNDQCEGKLAQRIDHFCGKKGLDIKGLSRKTIEKLIDWRWIHELGDLFKLDGYKTQWISKEGFGEVSVGKILSAITSARTSTRLEQFISALGIPLVGTTVAKEIIKYYSTWDDFRAAVGSDWTEFDGFGPEISYSLNNFDYWEADKIAELFTFVQPEVQKKVKPAAAIKDKVFCVTGKLNNYTRDSIKAEIESLGGKVASGVTSKVNYLITNTPDSGTAKNRDAQKLGIPIITEKEYMEMK